MERVETCCQGDGTYKKRITGMGILVACFEVMFSDLTVLLRIGGHKEWGVGGAVSDKR
jgi:hypothetical protein